MTRKQYLGITLSAGISILFRYLALRGVNFKEAFAAMRQANYWYLIPASLILVLAFIIRSLRWQILMQPIKVISYLNAFSILMVGFMTLNILPLRMGEFVRPYLIGKKENISRTASLATVVLERLFDVVSLLTFMVISLIASPRFPRTVRIGGIALGIFVFFLLIFFWLLAHYQEKVVNLVERLISPFSARIAQKTSDLLFKFITGLEVLKKGSHMFWVLISSLFIWLLTCYIFWFTGLAFGFKWGIIDAAFVTVITALGILVPSSPGFVGTFQYFCVSAVLIISAANKDTALSYSIVLNILQFMVIVGIGFICLWIEGIGLTELTAAENES